MEQATLSRVVSSAERMRLDPQQASDHIDRLFRAAWALCGSREDAEDLVQETYARVLAKPRFLRSEDDLGYLLRTLRNTFLNQKRTQSRRLRTAPLPDELDVVADPRATDPGRTWWSACRTIRPTNLPMISTTSRFCARCSFSMS